jgi:hypothetical protein
MAQERRIATKMNGNQCLVCGLPWLGRAHRPLDGLLANAPRNHNEEQFHYVLRVIGGGEALYAIPADLVVGAALARLAVVRRPPPSQGEEPVIEDLREARTIVSLRWDQSQNMYITF